MDMELSLCEVHLFDLPLDFSDDALVDVFALRDVFLVAFVAAVHGERLADVCCHIPALADVQVIEGEGRALHDFLIDRRIRLGQLAVQLRDGDGGQLRGGQVHVQRRFGGEHGQHAGLHKELADQEVGISDLFLMLVVCDEGIQVFCVAVIE